MISIFCIFPPITGHGQVLYSTLASCRLTAKPLGLGGGGGGGGGARHGDTSVGGFVAYRGSEPSLSSLSSISVPVTQRVDSAVVIGAA